MNTYSPGEVKASATPPAEPVAYDFSRPVQLTREQARALDVVFESFATRAATVVTGVMRGACVGVSRGTTQVTYGEYISAIKHDEALVIFDADPIGGSGVLQIGIGTLMTFLDRMLGGSMHSEDRSTSAQPIRPLTDLEFSVARLVLDGLLEELDQTFAPIVELAPTIDRVEYNPGQLHLARFSEAMVTAGIVLNCAGQELPLTIAVPFAELQPHLTSLHHLTGGPSPREAVQDAQNAQRMEQSFARVQVDVVVNFRPSKMLADKLGQLAVGDVIRLNHPMSAPLEVRTGNRLFAHATAGVQGTNVAALVVDVISKENS